MAAASDPEMLAFMVDRGARAKCIAGVCSGPLVLGAASLLGSFHAPTSP
ncbi:hypothetical protein [Paramesorhizobium deserti]|nr:hypothetical protein [Paramesorhizobium deserti]